MNATGKRRLLSVADFLDKLPRGRFDLDWWGDSDLSQCGTTACALGWATTIPSIQKAGLRMGACGPATHLNKFDPLAAAAEIFSIDVGAASDLFMPGSYANGERTHPKTVAKRIRELVAAR